MSARRRCRLASRAGPLLSKATIVSTRGGGPGGAHCPRQGSVGFGSECGVPRPMGIWTSRTFSAALRAVTYAPSGPSSCDSVFLSRLSARFDSLRRRELVKPGVFRPAECMLAFALAALRGKRAVSTRIGKCSINPAQCRAFSDYPQKCPCGYQHFIPVNFSCCSAIFLSEAGRNAKVLTPPRILGAKGGTQRAGGLERLRGSWDFL